MEKPPVAPLFLELESTFWNWMLAAYWLASVDGAVIVSLITICFGVVYQFEAAWMQC